MVNAQDVEKHKGKKEQGDPANYAEKREALVAMGYHEDAVDEVLAQLESRYGEKPGLWENIHRKRERIKRGSGERMRKPGEKGAPSAADIKAAGEDDD